VKWSNSRPLHEQRRRASEAQGAANAGPRAVPSPVISLADDGQTDSRKVRDVRCGNGGSAGKRYRCDLGIRLADKSTGLMTSDGQQGMGIGSPQVEGQYSALKVLRKHRMDRQVAAALSLREKARTVEDFCLRDRRDEDRPPGLGRQSDAKWIGLREKRGQ
jgi:hypothetical protein